MIDPRSFARALNAAESHLTIDNIDFDVLALVQAHVDTEYENVLKAEDGDPVAAAIAFMLRGAYAAAAIGLPND